MFSRQLAVLVVYFLCFRDSFGYRFVLTSSRCRNGLRCASSDAAVSGSDNVEPNTSRITSTRNTVEAADDDKDVLDDFDFTLDESILGESIEQAVKQLLDEGPKGPEISPVEKFQMMYKVCHIF
jgi:hypothetical protein